EVLLRQPTVPLLRSGEVGVETATWRPDISPGAVEQSFPLQPVEGRKTVARLVYIDVEHIRSRRTCGDGHVAARYLLPPADDPVGIGASRRCPICRDEAEAEAEL